MDDVATGGAGTGPAKDGRPTSRDRVALGLVWLATAVAAVPGAGGVWFLLSHGIGGGWMVVLVVGVGYLVGLGMLVASFHRALAVRSLVRERLGAVPQRYHVLAGAWVATIALATFVVLLAGRHAILGAASVAPLILLSLLVVTVALRTALARDGGGRRPSQSSVRPWENL